MNQDPIERAFVCAGAQELQTVRYSALRSFHMDGNYAMLAIAFLSLEEVSRRLVRLGAAHRHQLSVRCAHPGSGVRDAIEFVTRAQTRGAWVVQRDMAVPRLSPHADFAYAWAFEGPHRSLLCQLRAGVLPPRFFELLGLARAGRLDDAAQAEMAQLKQALEAQVLGLEPADVFEFLEQAP